MKAGRGGGDAAGALQATADLDRRAGLGRRCGGSAGGLRGEGAVTRRPAVRAAQECARAGAGRGGTVSRLPLRAVSGRVRVCTLHAAGN